LPQETVQNLGGGNWLSLLLRLVPRWSALWSPPPGSWRPRC